MKEKKLKLLGLRYSPIWQESAMENNVVCMYPILSVTDGQCLSVVHLIAMEVNLKWFLFLFFQEDAVFIILFVYHAVPPSVHPYDHFSLCPSVPQSVQVKTDSFAPKSLCPPVLLSNCQSVLLSFCPPACPSVSLSVHLSIHPSVILSIQVKTNGSRS